MSTANIISIEIKIHPNKRKKFSLCTIPSDIGLISKIYKEITELNNNKYKATQEKLNRLLHQEEHKYI